MAIPKGGRDSRNEQYWRRQIQPWPSSGLKVGQFCRSAEGATEIGNCYQIQRGYEHIDLRMRGLGADVELLED